MKKIILAIAIFVLMTSRVFALDLIVSAASGGTYHSFSSIIAKHLKAKGIEVNLKIYYKHLYYQQL